MPNPPASKPESTEGTPMDGVRKAEGGGEGATGEIAWVPFGVGRSADGLHRRTGAPMAVCGSCDARDGERIRSRELSRTGLARVWGDLRLSGWVGRSPTVPSGREWNGSQPGQGAAELLSPRPAVRKMQGQPACRAGEPSGQGEEPPPEGLGGGYPLSQTDPRRPAGQVVGIVWTASQAPLAAKRPEGRWFSPTPYLRSRMAFSTSAWRR